jgi:hypothetical protein
MVRRLTLSKGAYLWARGDMAFNIAVVEKGSLAVRSASGVIGKAFPETVLGEGAILALEEKDVVRTASVVALEDDTVVVEYAASHVKDTYESGSTLVGVQILTTLMAQTCRNLLLSICTMSPDGVIGITLKGMIGGLKNAVEALESVTRNKWDEFMVVFRFLYNLRGLSEQIRLASGETISGDILDKATEAAKKHFGGDDIRPLLEKFINMERDRSIWLDALRDAPL